MTTNYDEFSNDEPVSGGGDIGARIDRIPVWGLSRGFFLLLGVSYFFAFYDIVVMGVNMKPMLDSFGLREGASSLPVTANLLAYIVGAYVFGTLADMVGRRPALRISLAVLAVGSILTAFSWDIGSLTVFRVITGLGTGAQISLAATLASEFAGSKSRGRYVSANAVWGAFGFVVPPFVGLILLDLPHVGWRILFGLGALSALVLPFCRGTMLPESPRWLARRGRTGEAEEVVAAMERGAIKRTGAPLPAVANVEATAPDESAGFPTLRLLQSGLLGRLLIVLAFWIVFYLWVYGYLSYGPTILSDLGHSLGDTLLVAGLGNLGFLAGGLCAPFLIDRVERKFIVMGGASIAAIGFVLIAVGGHSASVVGMLVIGFGNFVALPAAYTYTGEIFPTEARGSAMAIGDGLGHVGGALAPFLVLPMLDGPGPRPTLWLLAALCALSALIIMTGVRTTGLAFAQLQKGTYSTHKRPVRR